ncbi:hypothetical protein BRC97_03255 [Halobacteriales archaeon QS_6_71_20]|nr:MAG: hypothetical protein BRC97_03255 [Halobacteriales archaeon QS_6_71_20]
MFNSDSAVVPVGAILVRFLCHVIAVCLDVVVHERIKPHRLDGVGGVVDDHEQMHVRSGERRLRSRNYFRVFIRETTLTPQLVAQTLTH